MRKIANYNYETKLKKCTLCSEEKDVNCYGQYKHKMTKQLYYLSRCKKCNNKTKTENWKKPEYEERRKNKSKRIGGIRKLNREQNDKTYQEYLEMCRTNRLKVKEANPELYNRKQKDSYLKSKYGITIEDYYQMVDNQNSKCLICKNEYPLYVDHNHTTHKVRGLLCSDCNSGIGLLKEDENILLSAIKYIKESNS